MSINIQQNCVHLHIKYSEVCERERQTDKRLLKDSTRQKDRREREREKERERERG
jgi:hypothetical protein